MVCFDVTRKRKFIEIGVLVLKELNCSEETISLFETTGIPTCYLTDKGTLRDINSAEKEMIEALQSRGNALCYAVIRSDEQDTTIYLILTKADLETFQQNANNGFCLLSDILDISEAAKKARHNAYAFIETNSGTEYLHIEIQNSHGILTQII